MTVRTPGNASADPGTGNTVRGPTTEVVTRAYLSQQSVAVLSASVEVNGRQDTTIATYTLLVPPDVALTAQSQVVDDAGRVYRINGQPAQRLGLGNRALFTAASMHLISDLQN